MKNEKKKRAIRYSAFVIAAILAIGSFSVWAMNTQATAEADVTIDQTPAGLNVDAVETVDPLIDGGMFGRPDSLESPDLFTVEQPSGNDYDGQYEVTVYVTNADELVDDFRYMNIDLTAENTAGSADVGFITLENGRVSFAVDANDIDDTTMTVSVDGGSYQATNGDINGGVNFLIDVEEGSTQNPVEFENND